MYIWTGIDVDDQLQAVKDTIKSAGDNLGYTNIYSSLPYHISLKMPFCIEDDKVSDIVKSILELYENTDEIKVSVRGIEKESGIVWIKMFENSILSSLCDELNEMLNAEYDVEIQEYDVDHEFHITLFIDDDERFIGQAFDLVKNADIPHELFLNNFVVGISETGEAGTYKYVFGREEKIIRKIEANELPLLAELNEYNDPDAMIAENTRLLENGSVDIWALFDGDTIVGELRSMYDAADERAERGVRAYLYAFRVREKYQGRGLGEFLLEKVIEVLEEKGYSEFTVGVEDDNDRARHIYEKLGFTEFLSRKSEEYQGDKYEYDLLLRKKSLNGD